MVLESVAQPDLRRCINSSCVSAASPGYFRQGSRPQPWDGGLLSFPFGFCIGSVHRVILVSVRLASANGYHTHIDWLLRAPAASITDADNFFKPEQAW